MRLGPGVRVGPYEVVAPLGAGGMAEVYAARDTRLGRNIAIKVVNEALAGDPELVRRFEQEARLAGSLNHPNILAVYDVGLHDGTPFFVTELLQGETLRQRLSHGRIPFQTALDWGTQMAEGLAAAHDEGVIHRDVKPDNVFVSPNGHVKLLDFGIAKLAEEVRDAGPHGLMDVTVTPAGRVTRTGSILGTPGYMSPEQVRGDAVDARTDIFSLGAVLYEVLSGNRAFPGATLVESGHAILHDEPEPLPETVPPSVAQIVHRCLGKAREQRFQSARDLAFHLEALRASRLGRASTPQDAVPEKRPRWWLLGVGLVGLLAVTGMLWSGASGRKLGPRTAEEPGGASEEGAAPSIAVLPFVNLSSDREQEYFSDGMTEELTVALARVKGLKVAGTTSSFHFKGKNEDLQTIGKALGVANVVEGSVRKQGNRVRIIAQLIRVENGFHLWSRTFEGDLNDVFDLQEKIARAVTGELKIVLQAGRQGRLVPVATLNPEAHALYLQATAIFNRREGERFPDAIGQLEKALELDPGYARAWSRLATLWILSLGYKPSNFDSALAAAETAAHRAIDLDSDLAEPHAVLGLALQERRHLLEARSAFQRGLEIDPNDVTANFWFSTALMGQGYLREAKQVLDRVLLLDPMHGNALNWRGLIAFAEDDLDLAERLGQRARDSGLAHVGILLSYVDDARGRHQAASSELARTLHLIASEFPIETIQVVARGTSGDVEARGQAVRLLKAYLDSRPAIVNAAVPYALLRLGRPAEAMELVGRGPTVDALVLPTLWLPYGRDARVLPQFSEAAQRMGLIEVWEHQGPPDLCNRLRPGRYLCH